MKKWEKPEVSNLSLDKTAVESDYITSCNWDGAMPAGVGNEDYTDPTQKPAQHPDWVWCHVHNRWHPKDHMKGEESTDQPQS